MNASKTEKVECESDRTNSLSASERDALKHALALISVGELEQVFELPAETEKRRQFEAPLRYIAKLQLFSDRIPPFGIVYNGRPAFMTDELVEKLRNESEKFRPNAWPLKGNDPSQYLYRPDTQDGHTYAEKLAESSELHQLVQKYAGEVLKSYITNYIYYDEAGQCSKPHIDNAFTSVTAMVAIEHTSKDGILSSSSVCYWPDMGRFDYRLKPGEISIFFGVSTLHGRTPIREGEKVTSLLLSFRPPVSNDDNQQAGQT